MAVGAKRKKPGRSRDFNVDVTLALNGILSMRWGTVTKKRINAVTPPAGRLIQKPIIYEQKN
jgi:hypothetical protein